MEITQKWTHRDPYYMGHVLMEHLQGLQMPCALCGKVVPLI